MKELLMIIGLGGTLVAYAFTNFATKREVKEIKTDLRQDISEIKEDVKYIRRRYEQ